MYNSKTSRLLAFIAVFSLVLTAVTLVDDQEASAAFTTTQQGTAGLIPALIGDGVTTSLESTTGVAAALGTFSDPAGVMGITNGIILSSGDIANIAGPNNNTEISANHGAPGDADVAALIGPTAVTNDAAVLEFTFEADWNKLYINYVVASDEYLEYVGFADAFGFWINGVNCATLPSGQPVSIATVNDTQNSSYYIDNDPFGPIYDTQADGFTQILTCVANVNVGSRCRRGRSRPDEPGRHRRGRDAGLPRPRRRRRSR